MLVLSTIYLQISTNLPTFFFQDRSELLLKGGYRYRKYRGRTESGCHASQLPEFQHTVLYGEVSTMLFQSSLIKLVNPIDVGRP